MLIGDRMQTMMFRAAALLLSLAFAGAPSVADYCAVSCETAPMKNASASPAHAGHHHSSTASSTDLHSIGQARQPCGHDHNGIAAVTAASDAAHTRLIMTASAAVLPASLPAASVWTSAADLHSSNSPPGPSPRGFASPIRV
jgi:hypothetical protein